MRVAGKFSTIHSPPASFFFIFFFYAEISSCAPISILEVQDQSTVVQRAAETIVKERSLTSCL